MDKSDQLIYAPPLLEEGRRALTQSQSENVRKAFADAERLKRLACAVLVLDAKGSIVRDIRHSPRASHAVRVIAVLAPAVMHGVRIPEADVLEIGFSRTRPYRRVESREEDRTYKFFLPERTRVRKLRAEEYAKIHRRLLEIMREMVLELRESWMTKEPWRIGPKDFERERGIIFSAHKSDVPIYVHLLNEEVRFRKTDYFPRMGRRLNRLLLRYHRGRYSDKQFQKLKGVDEARRLLQGKDDPPLFMREIIPHVDRRIRIMLDRMGTLFRISFARRGGTTMLVDVYADKACASIEGLWFCRDRRRKRSQQGEGCFVIEGFLDEKYRKEHEVPF